MAFIRAKGDDESQRGRFKVDPHHFFFAETAVGLTAVFVEWCKRKWCAVSGGG